MEEIDHTTVNPLTLVAVNSYFMEGQMNNGRILIQFQRRRSFAGVFKSTLDYIHIGPLGKY